MGQYFIAVNEDKREFIDPHVFGDGLKFQEFSCSSSGFLAGLALLLRRSSNGGGGDWYSYSADTKKAPLERFPIVGSWAGGKVSVLGDYDKSGLYMEAKGDYRNVSFPILKAMVKDYHVKEQLRQALDWRLAAGASQFTCDADELELYKDIFNEPTFQEEVVHDN